VRAFAAVSLVMTVAWLIVAFALFREHRRRWPELH
jgi:hypothetical protein